MKSGMLPKISAVLLVFTYCCAQATMPLPPTSSITPMTDASRHSPTLPRWNCRRWKTATMPRSTAPASVKRDPAIRNGGRLSSAQCTAM